MSGDGKYGTISAFKHKELVCITVSEDEPQAIRPQSIYIGKEEVKKLAEKLKELAGLGY